MTIERIALIGFGEVGQILGADLPLHGVTKLRAWDIRFVDSASPPARAVQESPVTAAASAPDAVAEADLVISAVTAAQAVEAAAAAAAGLRSGALYLDLNSASPALKRAAAGHVEAAGGRYVEATVMSPFSPKRLASPILLGGPHGPAFLEVAAALGFTGADLYSPQLGKASAAKMCRSVLVKGVEALLMEALVTARHYGVEEAVLASLNDLFPGPDWRRLARYMITRSITHGERRAEEMREAARTVAEAGLRPLMSESIARHQDRATCHRAVLETDTLGAMLDTILNAIATSEDKAS